MYTNRYFILETNRSTKRRYSRRTLDEMNRFVSPNAIQRASYEILLIFYYWLNVIAYIKTENKNDLFMLFGSVLFRINDTNIKGIGTKTVCSQEI